MSYKQNSSPYQPNSVFRKSQIPVYQLYGFESLTHDNAPNASGSGYFKVTAGYQCAKPVLNMYPGKLVGLGPGHKIALPQFNGNVIENYNSLKDLNIEMYYNDYCGYCQKAKDMLTQNGVIEQIQLKNVSEPNNSRDFKKHNARGVPFFVSKKTNKSHAGLPSSVDDLKKKLSN